MAACCQIKIYDNKLPVYSGDFAEPVELGRQSRPEERLYAPTREPSGRRVAVAKLEEQTISRKHLLVTPLDDDRIRLANVSTRQALRLEDGTEIPAQGALDIDLPVVLMLGNRTIRIQTAQEEPALRSLAEVTAPPGRASADSTFLAKIPSEGSVQMQALIRWLRTTQDVLHSAASSSDFFAKAAQAAVDLVGFDAGRVLIYENDDWQTRAVQTVPGQVSESAWQPSRQVLNRIREEKRTFWQAGGGSSSALASLRGIKAVVAAPILDRQGTVIGVLYCDRWREGRGVLSAGITELEAMLVELLASGVAAGLARMEQERAALAARVQFEQFFTAELAQQLITHPDLLQGRDADISVLFCDIRGFSRVSERLGSAKTMDWIGDVMGALSDCVLSYQGVLVDYLGDELMAMWGAPANQPNHAQLACRAALVMLACLPSLNERWQPVIDEPISFGIGINSGLARVGNTGTTRKFKYGPLGNTVNLASRVQGASKYLKTRLLITDSVHEQVGQEFSSRRLGRVRVVNIAEPVELFELAVTDQPGFLELKQDYETALDHFEQREFRKAARILGKLVTEHVNDGPSLVLMKRVVDCMADPEAFSPVWELAGK